MTPALLFWSAFIAIGAVVVIAYRYGRYVGMTAGLSVRLSQDAAGDWADGFGDVPALPSDFKRLHAGKDAL